MEAEMDISDGQYDLEMIVSGEADQSISHDPVTSSVPLKPSSLDANVASGANEDNGMQSPLRNTTVNTRSDRDTIANEDDGNEDDANDSRQLPLHQALANGATLQVVQALLQDNPQAAFDKDGKGRLPLYLALINRAAVEVVQSLLTHNPQAALGKDAKLDIPLHWAFKNNAPSDIVQALLQGNPEAAAEKDGTGRLPLHLALINKGGTLEVVQALLQANPRAASVRDRKAGRLPLHLALMHKAPSEVVRALVEANPLTVFKRANKRLPLQIALHTNALPEVFSFLFTPFLADQPLEPAVVEAWHTAAGDRRFASTVGMIIEQRPELELVKNSTGRTAFSNAHPDCREAMEQGLSFLSRYRIVKEIHRSTTSVVLIAIDLKAENKQEVALKLMQDHGQFLQETTTRKEFDLDPKFVVDLLRVHLDSSVANKGGDLDTRMRQLGVELHLEENFAKTKTLQSNEAEKYKYCAVMELAGRDLSDVITRECFAGQDRPKARSIAIEVGKALGHLHHQGVIHGDLKPLNIMRVGEMWRLVDLDASCRRGECFGSKAPSTGYSPPEMARVLLEAGTDRPQLIRKYRADVAHDLWSFGAVLLELLTGFKLWESRQGTDDVLESQLKELADWDADMCLKRLAQFSNTGIDSAAHQLLLQLLERDPATRLRHFGGSIDNVLKNAFFTGIGQQACKERVEEMHDMLRSPQDGFLINWAQKQPRQNMAPVQKKADDELLVQFETHISTAVLKNTRNEVGKAEEMVRKLKEEASNQPSDEQPEKLADAEGKVELLAVPEKILSYLQHLALLLRVIRNLSSHYSLENENSPSWPLHRRHARIVMHSYANFFQCLLQLDCLGEYSSITGGQQRDQLRRWSQRCWAMLAEQCRQDEGDDEALADDPLQFSAVVDGLPSAPQLRNLASQYILRAHQEDAEPSLPEDGDQWLQDLKSHLEPKSKSSTTFLGPKWGYLLVSELLDGLRGRLPDFAWATLRTDAGSGGDVPPRMLDLACRLALFLIGSGKHHAAKTSKLDGVSKHIRMVCSLSEEEVEKLQHFKKADVDTGTKRTIGTKRAFGQLGM